MQMLSCFSATLWLNKLFFSCYWIYHLSDSLTCLSSYAINSFVLEKYDHIFLLVFKIQKLQVIVIKTFMSITFCFSHFKGILCIIGWWKEKEIKPHDKVLLLEIWQVIKNPRPSLTNTLDHFPKLRDILLQLENIHS